jgi:hypothetical protein
MVVEVSDSETRKKARKRANGAGVPEAVADLSLREQQTFERDFKRTTAEGSRWREMARNAGRGYLALGWRMYRDAVREKPRRRKGPDECHDKNCPCVAHRRRGLAQVEGVQLSMCGLDGSELCEAWPACEHVAKEAISA